MKKSYVEWKSELDGIAKNVKFQEMKSKALLREIERNVNLSGEAYAAFHSCHEHTCPIIIGRRLYGHASISLEEAEKLRDTLTIWLDWVQGAREDLP